MYGVVGLELFGAVLGGLVFASLYGLNASWYGSATGRHLMAMAAAMTFKDLSLLLLVSNVRVPLWVFAVSYALLNWVIWWRVWLLVEAMQWDEEGTGVAAWIYTGLRTAAQALWGILVARLADAGITLPDWVQGWFTETLIVAGGIGLITAAIRWLETRKGDSLWARMARTVAKIVMLGLSKQPVYVTPVPGASPTTVVYDTTQTKTAMKE